MTQRAPFTFCHPLRVRWAECDAQSIVFNVNYFLYYDVGMTEYFRALGFSGDAMLEFFTAHAQADFRAPAHFDDELQIGVRCAHIGNSSMRMDVSIFRSDDLLNEGHMIYVHAEQGTSTPSPLPGAFIEKIIAFEKTSPEGRTA